MPQCCYLAKGAKRPSHTTNMISIFGLVQPKFIFGLVKPKFIFGLVQPKFIFGLVNSRPYKTRKQPSSIIFFHLRAKSYLSQKRTRWLKQRSLSSKSAKSWKYETRRERPKSAPYLRLKNIQGTTIGKKNFSKKKFLIFFRKKVFFRSHNAEKLKKRPFRLIQRFLQTENWKMNKYER